LSQIALDCGRWNAQIAPEIGGAVLSLSLDGAPVLRPTPPDAILARDVRRTACYPLAPYANRIGAGRFVFDGTEHRLRPNLEGSPHPLHGVAWRRTWRVVGADACSAELALIHRPTLGDQRLDWPFAFDARQSFVLDETGLTIGLSLRNTGHTPAPAGLGLHPFFPRESGQTLAFAAVGGWANGPDMLPAARRAGGDWSFAVPRRIVDGVDNDFFGWDGCATLVGRRRTTINAEPVFGHLRVFAPPGAEFLAVEPVSHLADALNRAREPDCGLRILEPGEALSGQVSIIVEGVA
jgi:aldose 1-epimerase